MVPYSDNKHFQSHDLLEGETMKPFHVHQHFHIFSNSTFFVGKFRQKRSGLIRDLQIENDSRLGYVCTYSKPQPRRFTNSNEYSCQKHYIKITSTSQNLTAKTPENMPGCKRQPPCSNHQFSGALVVPGLKTKVRPLRQKTIL